MEIKKVPIDTYGFFSYFVPGVVVATFIFLIAATWIGHDPDTVSWINADIKNGRQFLEWIFGLTESQYITFLIMFIFASYVIGQIVFIVSGLLLEELVVNKIYGYGYLTIIKDADDTRNLRDSEGQAFYRLVITGLYLALFLYFLYPIFDVELIKWMLLVVIISLLIAVIIRLVEFYRFSYFKIEGKSDAVQEYSKFPFWLCIPIWLVAKLIEPIERGARHLLGLDRPFPKVTVLAFEKHFSDIFKINIDDRNKQEELGTELFWLPYWYITEKSPQLRDSINRHFRECHLMRNLSGAFLISALLLNTAVYLEIFTVNHEEIFLNITVLSLFLFSLLSAVRYYYVYYHQCSKSAFRMFLLLAMSESK